MPHLVRRTCINRPHVIRRGDVNDMQGWIKRGLIIYSVDGHMSATLCMSDTRLPCSSAPRARLRPLPSAMPPAADSTSPNGGFGVRGAVGSYDRGHTSVSQLKPGDINWEEIFGKHGALVPHRRYLLRAFINHARSCVGGYAVRKAPRHGHLLRSELSTRPRGSPPAARNGHRKLIAASRPM